MFRALTHIDKNAAGKYSPAAFFIKLKVYFYFVLGDKPR